MAASPFIYQKFKYCPACGAEYRVEGGNVAAAEPTQLKCSQCQFIFYIDPHTCNGVIIENDVGEILLVRRKLEPHKGTWDVPGGFVEQGETLEESVIRELQEELSVKVDNIAYITSMADVYEHGGVIVRTICFIMSARIASGTLKAADDVSAYAFFKKEDVLKQNIGFTGVRRAFEIYLEAA